MDNERPMSEEEITEFRKRSKDNFFMGDNEIIAALKRERAGYKEPLPGNEEAKELKADFRKMMAELDNTFKTVGEKVEASPVMASMIYLLKTLCYLNLEKLRSADDSGLVKELESEIKSIYEVLDQMPKSATRPTDEDRMSRILTVCKRMRERNQFTNLFDKE